MDPTSARASLLTYVSRWLYKPGSSSLILSTTIAAIPSLNVSVHDLDGNIIAGAQAFFRRLPDSPIETADFTAGLILSELFVTGIAGTDEDTSSLRARLDSINVQLSSLQRNTPCELTFTESREDAFKRFLSCVLEGALDTICSIHETRFVLEKYEFDPEGILLSPSDFASAPMEYTYDSRTLILSAPQRIDCLLVEDRDEGEKYLKTQWDLAGQTAEEDKVVGDAEAGRA